MSLASELSDEMLPFLSTLCERAGISQFETSTIATLIHNAFGIDGGTITPSEIEDAINNRGTVDWRRVSFASNEAMAGYCVGPLVGDERFLAIAVTLLYFLAIDHGFGEIGLCTGKVIDILHYTREFLDVEDQLMILKHLVGRD